MKVFGIIAIVPLALALLLTGLVQALGTTWGLFRHFWVLFKLLRTVLATVVLLLHMPTVSVLYIAGIAAETEVPISVAAGANSSTPGVA